MATLTDLLSEYDARRNRAEAQAIVAQTLRGAAALLDVEGAHAEAEIDKVTTPGGITIRGLNAMEQAGFTHAVIQGLLASRPQ